MGKVTIDGNWLSVDGQRVPLLSGEFHYFRHARVWWEQILDTIQSAGIRIVSTYVCWEFHELAPGSYDFTGQTDAQRDLEGFLDLCARKGMYVLARPGPYIGSEWKNWGVPNHAAAYHRLHPEFLKKVSHYLGAVLAVIRAHEVTRGGSVLMVQVDNEADMNQAIYTPTIGHPGFSPLFWKQIVAEGSADDQGSYRRWLKQEYVTVGALNEAWGTAYLDFADAQPLAVVPATRGEKQHLADDQRFWEAYSTEYLRQVAGIYRAQGLSVPLYTNTYSTPVPMNAPHMQELVDLVGPDFYCSTPVLPEELHGMSFGIRYARAANRIPWSPEFQAGTVPAWVDIRGAVTPGHHRYMGLLGLLFGLKGWSWYMLVNRDEWYFAPINEKGEPREQFYGHFRDLVRVFNALRWPDTARCCRTGLLWYRPHFWFSQHPAKALAHGQLGEVGRVSFKRRTRWTQVFTALHACDVDFELFDPGAKYVDLEDLSLLICAGFDFVDDVLPPRLFEYVRSGGNLVLFGAPPVKNMRGDSRSAFAQVLPPLESVVDWGGEVRCTCEEAVFHTSTLQVCTYDLSQYPEAVPISALAATAGYILPFGRGHFCMLGLDATRETLGFVHRRLNVPIPSQSDTDRLLTSAWRGPDGVVIVAVNVGAEDVSADVRLDLSALGLRDEQMYRVTEMLAQQSRVLAGADLSLFRVAVHSRDGHIYHIQPV